MSNNANEQANDFESVKNRLAEIADTVADESLSLDDALDLYEEAVALGLQASDLLEAGIVVTEEGEDEASAEGGAEAHDEGENGTAAAGEQAPAEHASAQAQPHADASTEAQAEAAND